MKKNHKRVFKFRAWFGNVMFQTIISKDEGFIFVAVRDLKKSKQSQLWYPANIVFADKRATILQYTGFKDEEGKEIYEDDIISYTDIEPAVVYFGANDYDDKASAWSVRFRDKSYFMDKSIAKGIVIGNIFENPERVKK